jgi:hypothetical protein
MCPHKLPSASTTLAPHQLHSTLRYLGRPGIRRRVCFAAGPIPAARWVAWLLLRRPHPPRTPFWGPPCLLCDDVISCPVFINASPRCHARKGPPLPGPPQCPPLHRRNASIASILARAHIYAYTPCALASTHSPPPRLPFRARSRLRVHRPLRVPTCVVEGAP